MAVLTRDLRGTRYMSGGIGHTTCLRAALPERASFKNDQAQSKTFMMHCLPSGRTSEIVVTMVSTICSRAFHGGAAAKRCARQTRSCAAPGQCQQATRENLRQILKSGMSQRLAAVAFSNNLARTWRFPPGSKINLTDNVIFKQSC